MTISEATREQADSGSRDRRFRDLWASTGVVAVVYWLASRSTRGWCESDNTDGIGMCTDWTLRPHPVVFVVLLLVAVIATTIMKRRRGDSARVARFALAAVWLVVVAATVIGIASFQSVSIDDWEAGDIVRYPWWIRVDETITLN